MDETKFHTRPASSEEDVIAFYNDYAGSWDTRFEEGEATRHFTESRWRCFENLLGPDGQGAVALELGVGTGVYIGRASRIFRHLIAVDGSERMLDRVRERLEREGIANVSVLKSNVLSMPDVSGGSIDVAYFFGLIEHIVHVDAFLKEVGRVVRPGGLVIGVTPNASSPWYRIRRLVRGTGKHCSTDRYYSAGELVQLLSSRGFACEAVRFWGALPAGLKSRLLYALLARLERPLERSFLSRYLGGMAARFRRL